MDGPRLGKPVFPNGVHPFDVAATAYEFGLSSLIFTGPPDAAAALVRAGFAPVAFVKAGKGRHALVITGVRQPKDLAQRKHAGHELRLADPDQLTAVHGQRVYVEPGLSVVAPL